MKRVLLLSALALVLGAGLLRLLQHDQGYILIVIGGKSVEMRFWAAVLLLSVLVWAVLWLLKRFRRTAHLFTEGWSSIWNSRRQRAQVRFERGLLHYIEGDWAAGQKALLKSIKDDPASFLAYLTAAECARRQNDLATARDIMAKAPQGNNEHWYISAELEKVKLLLHEGRIDQGLTLLLQLKTRAPDNNSVLNLLQKTLYEKQDWPALETLLPDLALFKVLPPTTLQALQVAVYRQLLLTEVGPSERLTYLDSIWQRMPKDVKNAPECIAVYARLLISGGADDTAEAVLKRALTQQWHEELVELYGLAAATALTKQLATAEAWLKDHADDSVLLLTLGRLSLRNELWGQARDYFKASLGLNPLPTTYAELARLMARLGDQPQSIELYRQGLLLTAHSLPNLPMPKNSSSFG